MVYLRQNTYLALPNPHCEDLVGGMDSWGNLPEIEIVCIDGMKQQFVTFNSPVLPNCAATQQIKAIPQQSMLVISP